MDREAVAKPGKEVIKRLTDEIASLRKEIV